MQFKSIYQTTYNVCFNIYVMLNYRKIHEVETLEKKSFSHGIRKKSGSDLEPSEMVAPSYLAV